MERQPVGHGSISTILQLCTAYDTGHHVYGALTINLACLERDHGLVDGRLLPNASGCLTHHRGRRLEHLQGITSH